MKRILLGSLFGIFLAMWTCWFVGATHYVKVGVISWCVLSVLLWLTSVVWLRLESTPRWRAWRARRRQRRDFSRARAHKRGDT
jgi:hypothetical protein